MRQDKPGVLLVNLGTPDAPTTSAVKRYLKQFLSDKRVVDAPRWLWWPLLNFGILPIRSPRVSKLYASVWMDEGSPLMVYSQRQRNALAARLDMPVALGMSYGNPSLKSAIDSLMAEGVTRLIVLPLYPQFSCSTVAAVWDGITQVFAGYRSLPSVHFIRDYAQHPAYIAALKASVERSFAQHGKPDLLVTSFHGIPQRFADEGDDYPQRCYETFEALKASLGLGDDEAMLTFQSRFGREPWLMPYTDKTMESLPGKGVKHVQIMSPGFASDCLETLEEIDGENREIFLHAGGTRFEYIPALNDDEAHITMMLELVNQYR
ncbi:ferrochelatase [Erwinia tasmaniensis]|uniref:Ferrochelatase n=1 Tax=Erwinia tasmaniensis (strain DSM 17950 / CFBP 7177 / CIP 109463 / NCPPB 4357 / Et1/99) TaxID=465817 RepID=HEMH_ERWT9|nr:ferrochelatase [Erwinia tasmaniensis]B2VHX1.1 RecName: Full=Ferrochelatase; AltName: Full=Heme synthase; AltName: Full=Protoheme ferro-lyase [Erwinia tasmaniensis Et1/99]CAO97510.1 Ferrochelatase (Protoheme ferro-lyase; Heme synthetase) [Erwinia tasmaniensis Et1/99]